MTASEKTTQPPSTPPTRTVELTDWEISAALKTAERRIDDICAYCWGKFSSETQDEIQERDCLMSLVRKLKLAGAGERTGVPE